MISVILGLCSISSKGCRFTMPPPLCASMAPSFSHSVLFCLVEIYMQFKAYCPRVAKGVGGRVRTSPSLYISWRAYLKMLIPEPSSHFRLWMLIL